METALYIFGVVLIGGFFLAAILLVVLAQRQSLADNSQLSRNRMLLGECRRCGYNLNKNTSGVCPECGTPLIEDPDLFVPGRLTCCMCGKLLDWEDREGDGNWDGVLTTPPALLPESEPMRKYVSAQMHRSCGMLTCKSPRKVMRAAFSLAREALPKYSSKFSRHDFTLPQLFACLVVREHQKKSYRQLEALLRDARHWCREIGMKKVPDHNTLCRALKMLNLTRRCGKLGTEN